MILRKGKGRVYAIHLTWCMFEDAPKELTLGYWVYVIGWWRWGMGGLGDVVSDLVVRLASYELVVLGGLYISVHLGHYRYCRG